MTEYASQKQQKQPEVLTRRSIDTILLDLVQDVGVVLTQNSAILNEQGEARISRRLMHEKLEKVQGDVRELQDVVREMSPIVKQHEKDWQKIRLGQAFVAFIWSVVVLGMGFGSSYIWDYFKRHWN